MSNVAAVVPATDAELFSLYFPHIKYLVSRARIRAEYVEDYAMTLMMKIIDKGLLNQYDPGHESAANFKTFLSNFCNSYLRHFAERDSINAYRSRISTSVMVGNSGAHQGTHDGIPILDFLGVVTEPDTDAVEADELVRSVKKYFAEDAKMLLFLEMVLLQVDEHGEVIVKELAELYGVTRSSIHNWLKKLFVGFEQCR